MASEELDLAYRLLDLDLVDGEGRRCGKVDDIEITGDPGGPAYVEALLSGVATFPGRLPRWLRPLGERLFRGEVVALEWGEVEDFSSAVKLRRTAAELGLGRGDVRAGETVARLPGGER